MANVLPPQDRIALRRSYWLRVGITMTFMLTAAMTIGSVTLIPAFLTARTDFNEVQRYQELQGETREAAKRDTAVVTARLVNAQIDEVLKTKKSSAANAIELALRDWEVHAEDIIISGLTYDLIEEKEITPQLRISGVARSRAALNEFVQTLRADPAFADVSFPVSDLAGGEVVDFSLTLQFESFES